MNTYILENKKKYKFFNVIIFIFLYILYSVGLKVFTVFNFFVYEKIHILNTEYGMNINPKDYDIFLILGKHFNINHDLLHTVSFLIFYLIIFGIIVGYVYRKADVLKKK